MQLLTPRDDVAFLPSPESSRQRTLVVIDWLVRKQGFPHIPHSFTCPASSEHIAYLWDAEQGE